MARIVALLFRSGLMTTQQPMDSSSFQRVSAAGARVPGRRSEYGRQHPTGGTIKPGILVLGDGRIGRGAAQAALECERPVVLIGDREDDGSSGLDRSREPAARVIRLPATLRDETDGLALAARIRSLELPLAGVVATTPCRPTAGRVLDHPADVLRDEIGTYVLPQLTAARHLLPLIADVGRTGSYVLIAGPGGDMPWSGYGYRSVTTAALNMLALVLRDEARSLAVRVQLLSVTAPVRTDAPATHACHEWPSALAVGRHALRLIERRDAREAAQAVVRHVAGSHESTSHPVNPQHPVEDGRVDSTSSGIEDPSQGVRS